MSMQNFFHILIQSKYKVSMPPSCSRLAIVSLVVGVVVVVIVVLAMGAATQIHTFGRIPFQLTGPDNNTTMVVSARIGGSHLSMQVDSGTTGSCIVNGYALAADSKAYDPHAVERVPETSAQFALLDMATREACTNYSGGIQVSAATAARDITQYSQLWLCGCLELRAGRGSYVCAARASRRGRGDVMRATTSARGPHIITLDFLRDTAPCVLWMQGRTWEVCRGLRAGWLRTAFGAKPVNLSASDGSIIVDVVVGGSARRLVLDTGAGFAVMVANASLSGCNLKTLNISTTHADARGETIVGHLYEGTVHLAGQSFEHVPIVHSPKVHVPPEADGIIGLGLLRSVDVYLGRTTLGWRFNGVPPISVNAYTHE